MSSESLSISNKSYNSSTEKQDPTKKKKRWKWNFRDPNSPNEIYNWTLYLSIFVFGMTGMARGMDEGTVAGNLYQESFRDIFGFNEPGRSESFLADLRANIAGMVMIGSVGGSLISIWSIDYFGRVNCLRIVCAIQVVGALIQVFARNLPVLYVGRLIEGLGVGQTTALGPCYLSEVAMPEARGFIVGIFNGAVYLAICLGYLSNYLTAKHMTPGDNLQWMIPVAIKVIVAGLVGLGSFVTVESPRWLIKAHKKERAVKNLCKLRNLPQEHPYIQGELKDIETQVEMEHAKIDGYPWYLRLKHLFTRPNLFKRVFVIGIVSQLIGQWGGSNVITMYSPFLFQLATGSEGGIENLTNTLILGVIKLCASYFVGFFLIDTLGRRICLHTGIIIQGCCVLYFALFLNLIPADDPNYTLSPSEERVALGALAALFLGGVGWVVGFNAVQYLIGPEILDTTYRGVGAALIQFFHFVNQWANVRTVPLMMVTMQNHGAFYFLFVINVICLIWAYICVPEIKGKSLESMDAIFELPWYMIGRKGGKVADRSAIHQVTHHDDEGVIDLVNDDPEKGKVEYVENKK
ncbi:unnamed protein product [Candida verbasci]|uniref:Major facilitator superfamily (MFS) profile domain-containing protein n=1 Tax=Candida verbasci TaxID=1227364 RepID=A0A9W4TWI8_9ASCO|nr:unnamed protein product [Candida verbasci]